MSELNRLLNNLTNLLLSEYAAKTFGKFGRDLHGAVLHLWRGDSDEFAFIDNMMGSIDTQFRKAWNEGMREVGIMPGDMLPEWEAVLIDRINQEYEYILSFAEDILKAREAGAPIGPLYTRADMWQARYNEVRELAKITAGSDQRYAWTLGPTEHCSTCLALSGIVAFGSVWSASGWRPQSHDLECGGYRCQCFLNPTNDKITRRQPQDVS